MFPFEVSTIAYSNTIILLDPSFNPDGFFLSNGPGDPSVMTDVINTTKELTDDGKPVFWICLGHQILALSEGVNTFKMHNGHRGINHPVKNLATGKALPWAIIMNNNINNIYFLYEQKYKSLWKRS